MGTYGPMVDGGNWRYRYLAHKCGTILYVSQPSLVKQRRDITSVQTVSSGGGIEFRLTFLITGGIHRSAANKQQSKYYKVPPRVPFQPSRKLINFRMPLNWYTVPSAAFNSDVDRASGPHNKTNLILTRALEELFQSKSITTQCTGPPSTHSWGFLCFFRQAASASAYHPASK